jgi:anaerobic ribonucleoside-triphosphate reductase activating protein
MSDLSPKPAALRVAHRVACSEAEGPHRRYALWVQGCSLGCPGCCNPELFAAAGGTVLTVDELLADILAAQVEGVTLLGGEPLEQIAGVTALAGRVRAAGLGVLVFSGYTLDEIVALPGGSALLAVVDTLVDGRFVAAAREPSDGRRVVGSRNQRLVHRTPRYADPALWRGPPRVELQVGPAGEIGVHGDPDLARRLTRASILLGRGVQARP